ncbi:unnamed protein product, partial [Symbiodinium microadriaticum]
YNYFPLTVESMRLNPAVTFVIVNIIEEGTEQSRKTELIVTKSAANNVKLLVLSLREWNRLVLDRLGIDIPFTPKWFYKLCDFKPALAFLFPDLLNAQPYQYWGYSDIDLIWGNFSRFVHLFQGQYYFVRPHWHDVVGMAQFFRLDNFSVRIFLSDPLYLELLRNQTYHNLDETGGYTPPTQRRYMDVSINQKVQLLAHSSQASHFRVNRGLHPSDNIHLEMKIVYPDQDIPVASWVHGSLRVVHRRLGFAAGREVLFAHRMLNIPFPQLPPSKREEVLQDMIAYGYLLPNWIPLLTRHMCRQHYVSSQSRHHQLYEYYPYNISCFGS